ncbi:MAG: hypothetical protein EAZ91_09655 [Cytophagales bacterium]|nr:MAG: hypothetical protein EAZ91_09655 [Cytophagales bacterium]
MQLIIETDEEYAPLFRAVAKAVKAKVRTNAKTPSEKKFNANKKGPFLEESIAKPGEKPSDLFKGAWEKDPTRTFETIRESAWKRNR